MPLHHHSTIPGVFLQILQIAYPLLILFVYLITFTVRSIATSHNDNDNLKPQTLLGPQGKPLPSKNHNIREPPPADSLDFSRARKLLFQWLNVGVCLSVAGNIIVVIVHAIYGRKEGWWCGQAPTVGIESVRGQTGHANLLDLSCGIIYGLHTPLNYAR